VDDKPLLETYPLLFEICEELQFTFQKTTEEGFKLANIPDLFFASTSIQLDVFIVPSVLSILLVKKTCFSWKGTSRPGEKKCHIRF
jgi:hypothetical protein